MPLFSQEIAGLIEGQFSPLGSSERPKQVSSRSSTVPRFPRRQGIGRWGMWRCRCHLCWWYVGRHDRPKYEASRESRNVGRWILDGKGSTLSSTMFSFFSCSLTGETQSLNVKTPVVPFWSLFGWSCICRKYTKNMQFKLLGAAAEAPAHGN